MIVYKANKTEFLHHSDFDDIENIVRERFLATTGLGVWSQHAGPELVLPRDCNLLGDRILGDKRKARGGLQYQ